jgi:uncharacterized alkaline shock family protein YloU
MSETLSTTPTASGSESSGAPGPTTIPPDRAAPSPARGGSLERPSQGGGAALKTEHGVTSISSSVVAKIAGLATQEIPGVQAMGKSMSRAFGSLRAKVPGGTASQSQGVSVEVGERQAAVDIDIVAYYGVSIVETSDAIRENVIDRIEKMTGLDVVEVNISVDDLYIDGDGDGVSQGSRVE